MVQLIYIDHDGKLDPLYGEEAIAYEQEMQLADAISLRRHQ
jgi:hypothetical protein